MFYNDVPETDEQKARRTMEGFGMAKEFDDWLAGGGARKPSADPGYAPATPMPAGSGMGFSMPQQSLLSPQQSSDVGFAMKPVREQAAEMIGRMGGRDQTAEFNAWMDRPKTGAAEDIRRLAGDGAAGRFLNQPKEYYGMGSTLPTSYSGGDNPADYGESTASPLPTPQPQQMYQHYSATANPASPAAIVSQMTREDSLGQFVGPPAPLTSFSPQNAATGSGNGIAYLNDGFQGGQASSYIPSFNSQFRSDPFSATDSFMANGPIQTLGVNGFRTGASSPAYDDSGMRQRNAVGAQNLAMESILGRQQEAGYRSKNDMMQTLLGIQSRNEIASDREANRFIGIIDKVPEGRRTPFIEEAMKKGTVDKQVGAGMLMDEMLSRAKQLSKTPNGVDTKRFLESVATEFDGNRMNKGELIKRLQMMGYTADQIAQYETDPTVGPLAKSILGPMVPYKTTGLQTIIEDAKRVPGNLANYMYR